MKNPIFQIVVDCKGSPVTRRNMYYLENLVKAVLGTEKAQPNFWITRSDIYHEFMAREVFAMPNMGSLSARPKVADEFRHEPSFDFYIDGATVPIGRLVNVKIPEAAE